MVWRVRIYCVAIRAVFSSLACLRRSPLSFGRVETRLEERSGNEVEWDGMGWDGTVDNVGIRRRHKSNGFLGGFELGHQALSHPRSRCRPRRFPGPRRADCNQVLS